MTLLDPRRITELRRLVGDELESIVESLIESMSAAIEQLRTALAEERLGDATQAAHRCRNDALLVGAAKLLRALTELEAAARDGQLKPAREAERRVWATWPATRDELERIARGSRLR